MDYLSQRQELIEYGIRLIDAGLTKGTGGNLSVFIREEGKMLIKPSGVPYHDIKPEDLVLMDLDGHILEGKLKPSSEFAMHSILYKHRPDINAVIHTHSTFATTLACLQKDLPAVDYLVAMGGGKDVKCAPYATYGTPELAENALQYMDGRMAVLLANHGIIAGGKSLSEAMGVIDEIEFCCELYVRCLSTGLKPVILSDEEMELMVKKFGSYGQNAQKDYVAPETAK